MAKVILICGKLCSGKSTLAEKLKVQESAVVLSCDELVLQVIGEYLGDRHEEITACAQAYLRQKASEIVRSGCNVILEWGFWTRKSRQEIMAFFRNAGVAFEWIVIRIPDKQWHEQIEKRNCAINGGQTGVYFIDQALLAKANSLFENVSQEEITEILTEYDAFVTECGIL